MRTIFSVFGVLAIIPLAFAATICFAIVMPLIVVFLAIIIAIEYIIDLPRRLIANYAQSRGLRITVGVLW